MSVDEIQSPGALAKGRAQVISQSLSEAARRARFSTRGRRSGAGGGFKARRGQRLFAFFKVVSLFLVVVVPTALAILYYGFLASDQFVSEGRFSVRTGQMSGMDGFAAITGIPAAQIVQDTLVVSSYIQSRPLLEHLQKELDFNRLYARPDADFYARLDPSKPIEKILTYWKGVSNVAIQAQGGIITLSVRAFRPEDAERVASAVIAASEGLVNELNDRVRRDAVSVTEADLRHAAERLAATQTALEQARNQEGVLDATLTGDTLNGLMASIRGEQLKMQQQYEAIRQTLSPDAPQISNLRAKIAAADAQLSQIQAQMTDAKTGNPAVLSATMTKLAALDLDRQVAESQYGSAAAGVERARIASQTKQIYLTTFVEPTVAEEATYPSRLWSIAAVLALGLTAWSVVFGLAVLARNHMA